MVARLAFVFWYGLVGRPQLRIHSRNNEWEVRPIDSGRYFGTWAATTMVRKSHTACTTQCH